MPAVFSGRFMVPAVLPGIVLATSLSGTSPAAGEDSCSRHRPPSQDRNILADFRDKAEWRYFDHFTDAATAARVGVCDNGTGYFRIELFSRSSEFKLFSEPHAAILITDAAGRIIAGKAITALAMGAYNSVGDQLDRRYFAVDSAEFDKAAYAFFRFKFCGWRQGFDRGVKENNGCYRSSLQRETKRLSEKLPGRMAKLDAEVGVPFILLGWKGIRLR